MSGPDAQPPQVTAAVIPPDPPRSRWGAIPHHLGRARTSTVVLSLLFVAVGVLWLNIRPDPPRPATTGTVVEEPEAPAPAAPTTEAPTTDEAPTSAPTSAPPTGSAETPTATSTGTTAPGRPTTGVPTATTEPAEPLPPTTTPAG